MDVDQLLTTARDNLTIRKVFGEPLEHDGITVIPAAVLIGGGGGGEGHDGDGQDGEGGGFGLRARPAGAYVIRDGQVSWQPAVDLNRLVSTLAAVAITYLISRVRLARIRARQP